eukprot:TRINITY_DN12468_c0_g1_i3.p1 TRINITY_DN12468_c0_g1~~TRINITY_DN12468_c0_g1_i3.p1  ORF type:complete len:1022 (-),score=211.60 TRINITY_DN12468_c0_g1_i3:42-3014(-)
MATPRRLDGVPALALAAATGTPRRLPSATCPSVATGYPELSGSSRQQQTPPPAAAPSSPRASPRAGTRSCSGRVASKSPDRVSSSGFRGSSVGGSGGLTRPSSPRASPRGAGARSSSSYAAAGALSSPRAGAGASAVVAVEVSGSAAAGGKAASSGLAWTPPGNVSAAAVGTTSGAEAIGSPTIGWRANVPLTPGAALARAIRGGSANNSPRCSAGAIAGGSSSSASRPANSSPRTSAALTGSGGSPSASRPKRVQGATATAGNDADGVVKATPVAGAADSPSKPRAAQARGIAASSLKQAQAQQARAQQQQPRQPRAQRPSLTSVPARRTTAGASSGSSKAGGSGVAGGGATSAGGGPRRNSVTATALVASSTSVASSASPTPRGPRSLQQQQLQQRQAEAQAALRVWGEVACSARRIQSAFRNFSACRMPMATLANAQGASRCIQRWYRMMRCKHRLQVILARLWWRMTLEVLQADAAARRIQGGVRMRQLRAHRRRAVRAVVVLQAWRRGASVRSAIRVLSWAAVRLQRWCRRRGARKRFLACLTKLVSEATAHVVRLQRFWRRVRARRRRYAKALLVDRSRSGRLSRVGAGLQTCVQQKASGSHPTRLGAAAGEGPGLGRRGNEHQGATRNTRRGRAQPTTGSHVRLRGPLSVELRAAAAAAAAAAASLQEAGSSGRAAVRSALANSAGAVAGAVSGGTGGVASSCISGGSSGPPPGGAATAAAAAARLAAAEAAAAARAATASGPPAPFLRSPSRQGGSGGHAGGSSGLGAALAVSPSPTLGHAGGATGASAANVDSIFARLLSLGLLSSTPQAPPWGQEQRGASDFDAVRGWLSTALPALEVRTVLRVECTLMAAAYAGVRQTLGPERLLWHGTSWDSVSNIVQHGFNRAYGGRHGAKLGRGTYFAEDAAYALRFCGRASPRAVLLAGVLPGRFCRGEEGLVEPPQADDTGARFDSTADDPEKPKVFCVFRDFQALPLYIAELV